MKVYKGIWIFGETGWNGRSGIFKDRVVKDSSTWIRIPEWFPFLKHMTYGLVCHSKDNEPYNLKTLDYLENRFDLVDHVFVEGEPTPFKLKYYTDTSKQPEGFILCENLMGDSIGDPRDAVFILKMGVTHPMPAEKGGRCNYGYSQTENKWMAWNQYAYSFFSAKSSVVKGDLGYRPSNVDEWIEWVKNFHERRYCEVITTGKGKKYTFYNFGEPERAITRSAPEEYGEGEWTAKTSADARQMAMNYANAL